MSRRAALVAAAALLVSGTVAIGTAALVEWPTEPQPLPPIAFSIEMSIRQYDVAVADDDTITLLTDDKLSYAPAWSPDGSQIAFARARPGSFEECCGYDVARVWLMDADGANPRPVGPWGIAPQIGPQWMPDGESVVYPVAHLERVGSEDAASLVELDIGTGSETVLVQDYPGYAFALSIDGTRLAVQARRGIAVLTLESGSMEVLAEDAVEDLEQLQWSPDDEWLAGLGRAQGSERWGLHAWKLDDERLVTVIAGSETIEDFTWVAPLRLLYCVTTESPAGNDEVVLRDELWSATIGSDEVTLDAVTEFGAESSGGSASAGDCIGRDMDARAPTP